VSHEETAKAAAHESRDICGAIELLPFQTDDDLAFAAATLREVAAKRAALAEQLKAITDPMRLAEQRVRELFKPALTDFATAEGLLRRKISKEHDRRALVQHKQLEQAAALAPKEPEQALALIEKATTPTPALPGVGTRRVWRWRYSDVSKIPDSFRVLDEVLIDSIVKKYKENAPAHVGGGIEVWAETSLAVKKQ
jgi:hypothetical protein